MNMRAIGFPLLVMLVASCSPAPPRRASLVDVQGTVSLRNESPLAGVRIYFFTFSDPRAISPTAPARAPATPPLLPYTISDSLGKFRLRLPEGRWNVWIGGQDESGVMRQHVATADLHLPSTSLELQYLGYRVSGHLIGPGNTTLGDGSLSITSGTNSMHLSVPSSGYRLLLPSAPLDILAIPGPEDGFPQVRYDSLLVSSDTTIDLSLDGNAVSGRATGPGGIPLYGGWIAASSANASANSTFTVDGSYRMYLPTGTYVLTLYTGGRGNGTHVYDPILIDSPRTLDFDLPAGTPVP